MKQANLLTVTLLGFTGVQAQSVPFSSLLTRGQGFNTFLGKGTKHGAVEVTQNGKRGEPGADGPPLTFNFTAPAYDAPNIDPESYFEPLDEDDLDKELADLGDGGDNSIDTRSLISRAAKPNCAGELSVDTKLHTEYESYLKALDISASATVSGWGQSASISGRYLDQSEFSSNSLIYLAKIEVKKQQNPDESFKFNDRIYKAKTFDQDFGDRWIRGFEAGGKMLARITITSKEKKTNEDLQAQAEASLKFWGVSADISASTKKSMEELSKSADVKVSLFYQGDLGQVQEKAGSPSTISSSSAEDAFAQVKSWSDKFIDNACSHTYNYRALLDEYPTLENFPSGQNIIKYGTAEKVAFIVLRQLSKLSEMNQLLQGVKSLSEDTRDDINLAYLDMVDASQEWIEVVAKKPTDARNTVKALIKKFNDDFYNVYKKDVPSKPVGQCGIQGRNRKCLKEEDCCSGGGECGQSQAHCGYSYGKFCQQGFGHECYKREAKEGQACGMYKNNAACISGLC